MSAQQKEEWTKKLVGKKIVEGAVTNDPKVRMPTADYAALDFVVLTTP